MSVLNFTLFLVWSFEWHAGGVLYGSSGKRLRRTIKNVKDPWFLWFLFCSILDKRAAKTSVWIRVLLIFRFKRSGELDLWTAFSWIFISQIDRGELPALEIFETVFSFFSARETAPLTSLRRFLNHFSTPAYVWEAKGHAPAPRYFVSWWESWHSQQFGSKDALPGYVRTKSKFWIWGLWNLPSEQCPFICHRVLPQFICYLWPFCQLIPLKSRWPEFKACQVLVSSGVLGFLTVGVQEICNFYLKRWLSALAFLVVCFPMALGACFLRCVQGALGVWQSRPDLLLPDGVKPQVSPPALFHSVWWLTAAVTRSGNRDLLVCFSWFGKRTAALSGVCLVTELRHL